MSSPSPSRQDIRARLQIARVAWESARDEVAAWQHQPDEGADGTQRLRNARLNLGLAGARYREALHEFSEEILRKS